jgi:hypothetical protein
MKNLLRLGSFTAVLSLSLAAGAGSQSNAPISAGQENARRDLAVEVLRGINTAELNNKMVRGGYVTWETLMANGDFTASGSTWLPQGDARFAQLKFSKGAQILPGWSLRLDVAEHGKAYDLVLEDLTDEKCGYAAITDERGVIRQGKAIDCEM